jgi:hypothetical protein
LRRARRLGSVGVGDELAVLSLTSDAQFMGAGVKIANDLTLTFGHAATAGQRRMYETAF